MAGFAGPKANDNSLVFGYDTGYGIFGNKKSVRFNQGEPTTNLIPTPSANGRFTTSNGWGTYNTNQYNSNTYFSIGTIGSVSSNIVTLSSVGRTIRTYDVLRPQTTGGGVTAGTNYFVRKLSDTTFTLHAYNSSQNGSQGYINSSTGKHKVHDSIWNDERISINSTNFPTMWWGGPHLPNSGLVKEIVEGGGYEKGTNCMRWHIHRGDSVADGMAYGVYTPVTAGDVITVSYWIKPGTPQAAGKTVNYTTYFGAGNSSYSTTYTLGEYGKWEQITHTWTASTTYSFYQYWFPQASTDIYYVDVADLQVEVNKGHATPFTLSSRSSTEGLLDLASTNTINVANVTFDSTGLPTFDGTNDYIDLGSDITIAPVDQGWTAEYVFNTNSASTLQHFNSAEADDFNANWLAILSSKLAVWDHGQGVWKYGNTQFSDGTWYHVAFVQESGTSMQYYVNGVAEGGDHTSFTFSSGYSALKTRYIGRYEYNGSYSRYFNGEIPVVKLYDRPLTADEISRNYKVYKNRFNI